jgi:hypothetical protein
MTMPPKKASRRRLQPRDAVPDRESTPENVELNPTKPPERTNGASISAIKAKPRSQAVSVPDPTQRKRRKPFVL